MAEPRSLFIRLKFPALASREFADKLLFCRGNLGRQPVKMARIKKIPCYFPDKQGNQARPDRQLALIVAKGAEQSARQTGTRTSLISTSLYARIA